MGTESLESFAFTWTAMTAAMMAPSALPFVLSFAKRTRRWPPAVAVLVAAYLAVWMCFGVAVYYASMDIPLPSVRSITALAIAFVGLYSFTPLKRLGQASCIEMCRRRDAVNGPAARAAVIEGVTYGVNCVACSAGVMLALVVLGMSNLVLLAAGSALVLIYKLAHPWTRRADVLLSAVLVVAGLVLALG